MYSADKLAVSIKESRIKSGITQEELAEALDVTPTHVKHMESGHRKPSVEVLFIIAQKLNMSVDSIIFSPNSENEKIIKDIGILLSQCTENELKIISDVASSVLKNR